jgi:hypothetical protein
MHEIHPYAAESCMNRYWERRAPRATQERNLRSKIWWFTEFCNSHYVSHFAAFFIVARTKISIAKSCKFNVHIRNVWMATTVQCDQTTYKSQLAKRWWNMCMSEIPLADRWVTIRTSRKGESDTGSTIVRKVPYRLVWWTLRVESDRSIHTHTRFHSNSSPSQVRSISTSEPIGWYVDTC